MLKKISTILAISILFVTLSCRENPATTSTDTASTDTSVTVDTASTSTQATETILPPPTYAIDHYKLCKVKPVKFTRPVKLQGQFDREPWEARVTSIEYLANPVMKNDERIQHPDWHLVAYNLDAITNLPLRKVEIRNQFFPDGDSLTVTSPAWLLLPASKSLDGNPGDVPREADHYLCYRAQSEKPVDRAVKLRDQFDEKRNKTEEVKLVTELFCVPVSKDGGRITNPKDHLTIYRIDPQDRYEIIAVARDQFGTRKLAVLQSEYLAVPTTKDRYSPQ